VLLELASALFAAACAGASARRLAFAVAPTALDHGLLLEALQADTGEDSRAWIRAALASGAGWEGALFDALAEPDEHRRDALVAEQLSEFDQLAARWASVPRVCARLATSAGFLFACIALLEGLALPAGEGFPEALHAALMSALSSLAIGVAGTSFCVAVHFRARRARAESGAAADRLAQGLRSPGARGPRRS
jgi:hypothetical protein